MEVRKSVSVVIPNYNGKHLLKEYLPYTYAAIKNTEFPYEIIVVDDASTDGSVDFLKAEYPEVIVISNTENRGFSYTCNRGIEVAECELILLLNTDVKLSPDYFEHQWKYFLRWDTFGVMGRITDMKGDKIQDAARMPKWTGFKLKTAYFYYTRSKSDRLYTLYLSGANALINAEKLKSIGGFNEMFSPYYCEDMELCMRAWLMKWKSYYEHTAICQHQVSASTKGHTSARKIKSIYFRNRFYFHAIYLNGFPLYAWYIQITLLDLIPRMLIGQFWILNSYFSLFTQNKLIQQHRTRLKNLMDEEESDIDIFDVIEKITTAMKNKKITRFNT